MAGHRLHQERRDVSRRPEAAQRRQGSTTGLVNITWRSNHYDQKLFTNVYDALKTLRGDNLQVEFTGNAFQNIGQANGVCRRSRSASSPR